MYNYLPKFLIIVLHKYQHKPRTVCRLNGKVVWEFIVFIITIA